MTLATTKEINQRIGRRLRTARRARSLTRGELAKRGDLAVTRFRECEIGRTRISVDELERLAAALRLPLAHFLEECVLCGD